MMAPPPEGGVLGSSGERVKALEEHQREALLKQLTEPLQFLHSLDLIHIFEYYYR